MAASVEPEEIVEYGQDLGRGNLVGIQPFVVPGDYASASALYARIAAYLDVACDMGWLGDKSVVLGSDGHTVVVKGASVLESGHRDRAAIVNLWLG